MNIKCSYLGIIYLSSLPLLKPSCKIFYNISLRTAMSRKPFSSFSTLSMFALKVRIYNIIAIRKIQKVVWEISGITEIKEHAFLFRYNNQVSRLNASSLISLRRAHGERRK